MGAIGLDLYLEILQKAMKYLQAQEAARAKGGDLSSEEQDALLRSMELDDATLLGLSDSLRG